MDGIENKEAINFLTSHEIAVLSTLSREGNVHGSVVYYCVIRGAMFILTKSESNKAHNMLAHPQVAVTIYDPNTIETLQLQGMARIEPDLETKKMVFEKLVVPRKYAGGELLPPVTELHEGSFIVFRIEPANIAYADYTRR